MWIPLEPEAMALMRLWDMIQLVQIRVQDNKIEPSSCRQPSRLPLSVNMAAELCAGAASPAFACIGSASTLGQATAKGEDREGRGEEVWIYTLSFSSLVQGWLHFHRHTLPYRDLE